MSMVPLTLLLLLVSCAHRINPQAKFVPHEERAHAVGNHVDRLRDF
jgi:hypothetical protein